MSIVFTEGELNRLKIKSLKLLAEYYNIHLEEKWTKEKIIEAIVLYQPPDEVDNNTMSVRVKRIREQNRG